MKTTSYLNDYMEIPDTIKLPKDTEISSDLIRKVLAIHDSRLERYELLQDYYKGKMLIYDRVKEDWKSNNRLTYDYPSYIVDVLLGMTVGKPVTYNSVDDDKAMDELQKVFDLNDEQDENTELMKLASINGVGYEIVYLDEDGDIRFNEINPKYIEFILDDTINGDPLMAFYIHEDISVENLGSDDKTNLVTIYTADYKYTYKQNGDSYNLIERSVNPFGILNVIRYRNNDEMIGDFERVLSLIDEMNLLQSDTANDFEEFTNAILVLYGAPQTTRDDTKRMQNDGTLLLDADQDAKYLTKEMNNDALVAYKQDLDTAIHKFAKVPNVADEKFGGNVSGESQKYKLFTTDQIIAQKHRKLRAALLSRIELIFAILNKKGNNFDYKQITINFSKNKPFNELDNVRVVQELLKAGVSREEALSRLEGLDDIQKELLREEAEASAYVDIFSGVNDEDKGV